MAAAPVAQARAHRRLRRTDDAATTPCWLANSGADYVMFGEPDADGRRPSFRRGARARRMVGGNADDPLRRLCGEPRRGRGAGARRRGFRRGRRDHLARCARRRAGGQVSAWRSRCDEIARGCSQSRRSALLGRRRADAQPMQISPPVARPPASIPAKPAQKPKAAQAKPGPAKKSIAEASGAEEVGRARRPRRRPPPRRRARSRPTTRRSRRSPRRKSPRASDQHQDHRAAPQSPVGEQGDVAFGAYQRGYYLAAFKEATRRASDRATRSP